MPLHESADSDGPGHDDSFWFPPFTQQDEPLLVVSATAVPQQDCPQPPSHEPSHTHEGSWMGRVAIPCRSSPLIRSTHMTQCALPGFTAFAAAIHCSSLNSTTGGGITPLEIAHTSRWCSVWQQQCVQHSVADAHPQPQFSQGYRSPVSWPNHPKITRGDGITPRDATR